MRVVFFGTSPFAVPTLAALAGSRHQLLSIVTQPDRPSGRGMQLSASAVKKASQLHAPEVPILQPEKVRRAPFPEELAALKADVLVVVSFGQIIPKKVLEIPRHGGINVHASLLPRWRGAAPIHWAILEGDEETGVATMRMEPTLDTGPIFLEHRERILPTDTPESLEPRLADAGARLLLETLDRLESDRTWEPTPQAEEGMTYASMLDRMTGLLDPLTQTAAQMERKIRALSPRPGAWLTVGGKELKVIEARPIDESGEPGAVLTVSRDGVFIGTVDGRLLLTRVQPAGKSVMAADAWARGARINSGDRTEKPF